MAIAVLCVLQEQTLTAMAMKERKEVEDKLNLETSK